MTDSWVDSNGDDIPSDWTPGAPLTPAGEWSGSCGCAAPDGPAIAKDVVITGSPGSVSSVQNGNTLWSLVLNDGTPAADLRIDRFDDTGALVDSPMTIVRATGVVSFNDPVMLAEDPVEPLEAATKQYVDENASGLPEAPMDNYSYARYMATWERLPQSYIPEAPNTSQRFGRYNSTWQLDAIQTDAPSDGGTYGRQSGAWNAALALTGGTITGSLTVNQVLTVQGSNSLVLNAPVTGSNQRSILGMASNVVRWVLTLGDQTTEGLNNTGSNFSLAAYSTTGAFLGYWLTVARADGSAVFNGSGVTIQGGLAVNGLLALASPNNLAIYGGAAGQVLSTNGSGVLSWATSLADAPSDGQYYARHNAAWAVAPGGMTDAPNDGTAYARKSLGWAHLAHTDITDWTATLAPYALTANVPVASTATPLPDGNAAIGVSTAYARADHVHPAVQLGVNRLINGDMRVDQRNQGASGTAVNVYTVDRWGFTSTQTGRGTWGRYAQGPASLAATGFAYALGFTSSSAYTPVASDNIAFYQAVEADNLTDFCFGTANAQPITLSFWVVASVAGTYGGAIRNMPSPPTRSYPFSFIIATANTWTKIVVTIPGDTAGTWVTSGNAGGLQLTFDLGCGATPRGPASAWASANYVGVSGAASVVSTNGGTFNLTGVKLEVGSVATPFNHQNIGQSMRDCQRYYQSGLLFMTLYSGASVNFQTSTNLPVAMRASPTLAIAGNSSLNMSSLGLATNGVSVWNTGTATAVGLTGANVTFTANAEL